LGTSGGKGGGVFPLSLYSASCLASGWKIALLPLIGFLSFSVLSLFFAFTGKERGWGWDLGGRFRWGDFGGVFPGSGVVEGGQTSLFRVLRSGREAVYTNNRLRTGTDKGNPTV